MYKSNHFHGLVFPPGPHFHPAEDTSSEAGEGRRMEPACQVLGAHRARAGQSKGQMGCCSPRRTAAYCQQIIPNCKQKTGNKPVLCSCAQAVCPHSKPPPSGRMAQPCSRAGLGTASLVLEEKNLGCCGRTVAEGHSAGLPAERQPRYHSSGGNNHEAHRKGQLPQRGPGVSPEACSGRAYPFPLHAPRAGERLKCHSK